MDLRKTGSSLTEGLQIPLISALSVNREQTLAPPSLFVSARAGLCQTLCKSV